MKKHWLSAPAMKNFLKIIDGVNESNQYKKIDNSNGAFMPVVIEYLGCYGEHKEYEKYSIAHHYVQNGDLMSDPDVEFYYSKKFNCVVPANITDYFGFRKYAQMSEDGRLMVGKHNDLLSFCAMWFRNIKDQQGIK